MSNRQIIYLKKIGEKPEKSDESPEKSKKSPEKSAEKSSAEFVFYKILYRIYSETFGVRTSSKDPESGQALCYANYLRKSLRTLTRHIDFLRTSSPLRKCSPDLK